MYHHDGWSSETLLIAVLFVVICSCGRYTMGGVCVCAVNPPSIDEWTRRSTCAESIRFFSLCGKQKNLIAPFIIYYYYYYYYFLPKKMKIDKVLKKKRKKKRNGGGGIEAVSVRIHSKGMPPLPI